MHRELFAPLGQGARTRESFVRAPLAGRRIKLGLVSADFHHQHPVNIFMQPVLREIDRSRFEVFLYFTGVSYDDQTRLAQRRAEQDKLGWKPVKPRPRKVSAALKAYAMLATSADKGAVRDLSLLGD